MNSSNRCTFCEKSGSQVAKIVSSGLASICNECLEVCNEILRRESENDERAGMETTDEFGVEPLPKQVDHIIRFDDPKACKGMVGAVWLIVGVIAFGVLMGWRGEMLSIWQRALTTSLAAIILMICVNQYRKAKQAS